MDFLLDYLDKMRCKKLLEEKYIDLRGIPCPINYVRCSLALEDIKINEFLNVDLDKGEPETTVISGLIDRGFKVDVITNKSSWLKIKVTRLAS